MSVLGAMYAGVAGLSSQSRKFAAISDNIANASTNGYKRASIDFLTSVTDAANRRTYAAGGVTTVANRQISKQGTLKAGSNAGDLAISGRGFFLVKTGTPDAQGLEQPILTRAGSFRLDQSGYLRNSAGHYLQGKRLDTAGEVVDPSMKPILLQQQGVAPEPTTKIDFLANLPSQMAVGDTVATSVEYIDQLGGTGIMKLQWTKLAPAAGQDRWQLDVTDDTGGVPTVALAPQTITFDTTGANAGQPVPALAAMALAGKNGQTIALTPEMTQYNGSYVPTFDKDGTRTGDLVNMEISESGVVFGVYDNGQRVPQYQLVIGDVTNPDGLTALNSNTYMLSNSSGDLNERIAGEGPVGEVSSFTLEGSNVDIAEELTSLIETQRAYSTNAKTITTADEMLDEVSRLKR